MCKPPPPPLGEGTEPSPFFASAERERSALLDGAKQSLPLRYQTLLQWRYEEGFTFTEIGARWEVSRAAVHQMHARALVLLREYLRARGIRDLRQI